MKDSTEYYRQKYKTGIQFRDSVVVLQEEPSRIDLYHESGISLRKLTDREVSFVKNLKIGIPLTDIEEALANPRIKKIVDILDQKGALKTSHWNKTQACSSSLDRQLEWLSNFTASPTQAQAAISSKRVFVLGCGGTGSVIAQHLSHAGVGEFVLMDGGVLDLPDLNRQLPYMPCQVGQSKVECLGEYLRAHDPKSEIAQIPRNAQTMKDLVEALQLYQPDIFVCGADTPIGLINSWAAQAAARTNTPVLFGNVGLEAATIGPFLVCNNAKEAYATKHKEIAERLADNASIMKSSIGFTNTLASAILAFDAFRFLSGCHPPLTLHKTYDLNFFSMTKTLVKNWEENLMSAAQSNLEMTEL